MKSFFNTIFSNQTEEVVTGLNKELKALYVYDKFINEDSSILLVTSSLYEANLFYKSISCYTKDVLFFPMDDFLTSEALAISPEFKNNRLMTLCDLNNKKIIVTNLMGYLRYLPIKEVFNDAILRIDKNKDYNMKELVQKLISLGYTRETIVSKTGEMAVRGFVIDIFLLGQSNPIRLEFWGDTIESIRIFDVETQLTLDNLESVQILPNTEFITSSGELSDKHRDLTKYGQVTNISGYFDNVITIFNEISEIQTSYQQLQQEIIEYKENSNLKKDIQFMNHLEDIQLKEKICLFKFDSTINISNQINYVSYDIDTLPKDLKELNQYLNQLIKQNKTVVICVSNHYQINKILDNLENSNFFVTNEKEIIKNKINLIIKPIENGFVYNEIVVISESELFHKKNTKIRYKNNFQYGSKIRDINKLSVGDYVVHNVHGIGKYLGIKTLIQNNLKKDYLIIEYKGGDKLYIPVEKIELISKYSTNDNLEPKINKLGGNEWSKTKLRVKQKLENIAGELLKLYAMRESSKGFAFKKDDQDQIDFENRFIYEDTVDQRKVTEEIKRDMEKEKPMDRLLCGDVGYGKTEIAFRAMFKAVMSNKQVAYLCPTTILSNQHYTNALERFKEYAVNIACLNRFVSQKETKKIIEGLKSGKIDIVIGTHRLLSDDIIFKDLGLLVVDEEQRFGVKHKEKIKQLKNNVDVLTLSATPIPRTLQMSMVGIRDLSLLETPPINRYPIQTYVLEENSQIIKDAIYKELARDGQVFILYNHVSDLENMSSQISKLVPEAKITYAHGQMTKVELENVMMSFINKEYNVLLCTTIIETGIDIPSVNTLIIIDADRFGLSQLYQIRGRVGRGNLIAYCYLMYKRGKVLSEIAEKRLSVIKEFTELGSGFAIAMRDLSIRGAGDILGSEQAGFIDSIGIELYLKMLEDEIKKLNGLPVMEEKTDEQPLINVATSISDDYVEETDLKIEIHKKINEINSYEMLNKIKLELEDRFGKLSDEMLIYMYEELFENKAKKIGITKVRQTNNFIELTLSKELTNQLDGQHLFLETSKLSRMFRFKMTLGCLVITLDIVKLENHYIYYLLDFIKILEQSKK